MDALYKDSKGYTELEASSLAVGLPEGLMGNSEVGHLNIGAGRVVWQDVVRIDQTIKNGQLGQNDVIKKTFQSVSAGNGRLHLCGLVSHGGVVSHIIYSSFLLLAVTYTTAARQANPPIRPPQGRQGVWRAQGLHPLLR